MTLVVHVYPDYTGEVMREEGETAAHWEAMWTNASHGSTLELQAPTPIRRLPFSGSDDSEEVTVQWTVELFAVKVEAASML